MKRLWLILGGLILLAALVYHCLRPQPPEIQPVIKDNVLPEPYVTSMCIDGDGGRISGSVGSAEVRATAGEFRTRYELVVPDLSSMATIRTRVGRETDALSSGCRRIPGDAPG